MKRRMNSDIDGKSHWHGLRHARIVKMKTNIMNMA